jgi:hypothetical protein
VLLRDSHSNRKRQQLAVQGLAANCASYEDLAADRSGPAE